jgi:hypothetical protein
MIIKKLLLVAVLLAPSLPVAQGVRYDIPPILGPTGQPLPNVAVTLCSGTGTITGAACSPQTQSFSDITLGVPCALGNPVTLTASTQCQNISDTFGNAGFWLSPGTYIYCLTGRGVAGACFNLTLPAGSTPSGTLRSGTIQLGDGSATAPSYSFTNSPGNGFFHPGAGSTGLAVSGVQRFNFGFNLQQDGTVGSYCFTNGNPFSVACDTGISRSAAGILAVGNGTVGDFSGTLKTSVAQLGDGSVSAPSQSFLNEPGTGLFRLGAQNLGFAFGGVGAFQLFSAGIANAPASVYSWVSSFNGPRDTGISRLSANVIGVGNGLQGDVSGTLQATSFKTVGSSGTIAYPLTNGCNPAALSANTNSLFGYSESGGALIFCNNGIITHIFNSATGGDFYLASGGNVGFQSTSTVSVGSGGDTNISRISAGVLGVGTGSQGSTAGTLKANTVNAVSGFQVNGTALAAQNLSNGVTGGGPVVLTNSPTLSTPFLNSPTLATPNILGASANTLTFTTQAAPANPPAGSITIYGDNGTGNLTCRNNSGGSCFSATAAAPFISGTANPASTGVLRVASGDTALAFRNNANSGDIVALTKDTNDVVQVGGPTGMKSSTFQATGNSGLPASCGGGAFFVNDTTSPNSADICFGDGTGWIFNFTKRTGSASTQVLQVRDTGTMMMNGGDAITANPPTPAVLSLGWKFTFWNGFAFGLGSSSIDVKTNGWMSVFAANPNNDASGAAPDSNAKVSLGSNGNVILAGNLKVGGGVTNNGSGMMHVRATSCTTPAAVNGSCVGTITWPGTWADTNYTAVCTADNSGLSTAAFVTEIDTKTTTTMRVGISNAATSSTSVTVILNCIGMHD